MSSPITQCFRFRKTERHHIGDSARTSSTVLLDVLDVGAVRHDSIAVTPVIGDVIVAYDRFSFAASRLARAWSTFAFDDRYCPLASSRSFCDIAFCLRQRLDAVEIELRDVERGLRIVQCRLRRIDLGLQRLRVHQEQDLAGTHDVALGVDALVEEAADARLDVDDCELWVCARYSKVIGISRGVATTVRQRSGVGSRRRRRRTRERPQPASNDSMAAPPSTQDAIPGRASSPSPDARASPVLDFVVERCFERRTISPPVHSGGKGTDPDGYAG